MKSRIPEVDLIRGTSVLVMILVHALLFFATPEVQTSGLGHAIMGLGKITAVFVLCMGISCAFSRRDDAAALLRRAGALLLLGYALNVLKFLVPLYVLHDLPDGLLLDLGLQSGNPDNFWYFLLLGDILQLAAFSLAAIALLRALGARPWQTLLLAAAVAVASPWLWGIRGSGPVGAYLGDLFFSESYAVFFPVFPWIAYALVGFALGEQLRQPALDHGRLFRRWFATGVALLVAGLAVGGRWPELWRGRDFYRTGPAGIAAVTGFALTLFLAARALWPRLPEAGQRLLAHASKRVTRLYVISWVVICWSVGPLGFMAHRRLLPLAAIAAAVFAATALIDRAIDQIAWRSSAARTAPGPTS